MNFKVTTKSAEYLDDAPTMRFEYESTNVLDFTEYVQSVRQKVKDLLNFDTAYRDTYQVVLTVEIDDVLRGTEYFRRSEAESKTLTVWYVIHPLP